MLSACVIHCITYVNVIYIYKLIYLLIYLVILNIYILSYIYTLSYRYKCIYILSFFITERSLEVKLPTIWKDEKQRWEESEKVREEKRKSQKQEDPGARKGRKVAKHCVFPMICDSGGSKCRLAKAAGVEPCGQMRDDKLHAVVARSTFPSQNVQKTPTSDHFWKL